MNNPPHIGVLGAGSWGTALADLLARKNFQVTLWARNPEIARTINASHQNPLYIKEAKLSSNIKATSQLQDAVSGKNIIVSVIPSHAVRAVFQEALGFLEENPLVISASKGIENQTLMTMHEVFKDVLPESCHHRLCFLSGPSFAAEVLKKHPTAVTIASENQTASKEAQELFFTQHFRTYSSNDVIGVELGGALKNVIAIAAGISDGLGFGVNSRAALITRGLGEIAQLGQTMGAQPITFLGLAGMGDLILTCTGDLSRNRFVGLQIGQGKKLDEILEHMNMVAEGVKTAKAVHDLSKQKNIEMVICNKVYEILYHDADPLKVVSEVMQRTLKSEFHWLDETEIKKPN